MTTATITVRYGDLSEDMAVELLSNSVGELVLSNAGTVRVRVADLGGLAAKIKETSLVMSLGLNELEADVTPNGCNVKSHKSISIAASAPHKELYDAAMAIERRKSAVRARLHEEDRIRSQAAQLAQVPAGFVAVQFAHSEADGSIQVYRDANGRPLESPEIAGASGRIAWMTPEAHAAAVAALAPKPVAAKVASAAIVIPAAAREAFDRYQGDADRAWEDENETDCMLIRQYGSAIEAGR